MKRATRQALYTLGLALAVAGCATCLLYTSDAADE